jgi:hypothetical protein
VAFTGAFNKPGFSTPKRSKVAGFWQENPGYPANQSLKQPLLKSIDRYFGEFDR